MTLQYLLAGLSLVRLYSTVEQLYEVLVACFIVFLLYFLCVCARARKGDILIFVVFSVFSLIMQLVSLYSY